MHPSVTYKLGKWPYTHRPRVLKLNNYLGFHFPNLDPDDPAAQPLAPPPATLDLTPGITTFPMYGNDQYGDCTCAAAGHMVQVWSQLIKAPTTPALPDVGKMYFAITNGADVGAVEHDVLRYWRRNPLAGWAPAAFIACNPNDPDHIKIAANLFGGVYIGLQLPTSAQYQLSQNQTWDYLPGILGSQPGSWGGHAVNVVGYDQTGLTVVTWGKTQKMTWNFWAAYCDEAWAILPNDWQKAPGFNWGQLETDLKEVAK